MSLDRVRVESSRIKEKNFVDELIERYKTLHFKIKQLEEKIEELERRIDEDSRQD